MLCKIIPRRLSIYSLLAFVLSVFIFSFFFSSDSFATSVSCTLSSSSLSSVSTTNIYLDSYCSVSSLDNSKPWHYVGSFTITNVSVQTSGSNYFCLSNTSTCTTTSSNNRFSFNFYYTNRRNAVTSSSAFELFSPFANVSNTLTPRHYTYLIKSDAFNSSTYITDYSISLTIDDTYFDNLGGSGGGSCPECEVCQVCPVVPDNPYDDKFDGVIRAIYVCAGTLLVLYFFYCIYRIIIKNSGVK